MNFVNKNIIYFLLASLMSCVEVFNPKLGGEDIQRLVVEAQLTTKMDYQYVYLTFDAPYDANISNFTYLVTRAKITISDDLGNSFEFYDKIENNNEIKISFFMVLLFSCLIIRKQKLYQTNHVFPSSGRSPVPYRVG